MKATFIRENCYSVFFWFLLVLNGPLLLMAQPDSLALSKAGTEKRTSTVQPLKGRLSLGGMWYNGNVRQLNLRVEGEVGKADTIREFSISVKGIRDEQEGQLSNEEISGLIRLDYRPFHDWTPFLMVSAYGNEFKGIRIRNSGLAGIKYSFFQKYASEQRTNQNYLSQYSVSAAIQYDREQFSPGVDKGLDESFKLSIRPRFKQKFGGGYRLEQTTFFRINVLNSFDYRIDNESRIVKELSRNFAFSLVFSYEFVNRPPFRDDREIEKKDASIIASITFSY